MMDQNRIIGIGCLKSVIRYDSIVTVLPTAWVTEKANPTRRGGKNSLFKKNNKVNPPATPISTRTIHVETIHPWSKKMRPNPNTNETLKHMIMETLLEKYFLMPAVINFPPTPARAMRLEFKKMLPPRFFVL